MPKIEKQINWSFFLIVFLFSLLMAGNVFFYLNLQSQKQAITELSTEIDKLKADDLVIAQVMNNLISQLQALRILPVNQAETK